MTPIEQLSIEQLQGYVSGPAERREWIATAALQGFLAGRNQVGFQDRFDHHSLVAKSCLQYADALIAELDRKEGV